MQLSRTLSLKMERTYRRKIAEMLIVPHLESNYSKRELLELYLNAINYGSGNADLYSAAQAYFQKPPLALTVGESLQILTIIQAPLRFATQQKRTAMLKRMQFNFDKLWTNYLFGARERQDILSDGQLHSPVQEAWYRCLLGRRFYQALHASSCLNCRPLVLRRHH